MQKSKITKALHLSYIITVLLIIYIPIISMVLVSVNAPRSLIRFSGISGKWYREVFIDSDFRGAVINTILIAIIAMIVSTIIGIIGALTLAKLKRSTRKIILGINEIPMFNTDIITAISLFVIFGALRIPNGYISIIIAHITFCVPFVVVTVYPKIMQLDENLSDAAADLGATQFQTIMKVILPQLKSSIFASLAISFALSFDDFVISYFAAGNSGIKNISIYLYTLKRDVKPTVNAFSVLVLLVLLSKLVVDAILWKKKNKKNLKRGIG